MDTNGAIAAKSREDVDGAIVAKVQNDVVDNNGAVVHVDGAAAKED
ncbi:hypothetical protein [Neobacillus niacini]|nr:hypothetical protein [Neobacillus niacini]